MFVALLPVNKVFDMTRVDSMMSSAPPWAPAPLSRRMLSTWATVVLFWMAMAPPVPAVLVVVGSQIISHGGPDSEEPGNSCCQTAAMIAGHVAADDAVLDGQGGRSQVDIHLQPATGAAGGVIGDGW